MDLLGIIAALLFTAIFSAVSTQLLVKGDD